MAGEMSAFIERELAASRAAITAVHEDMAYRADVAQVAELFIQTMQSGSTLLFAGNGGSAADAQHIAGELVSRFHFDRPGLPAISLSTDTSILTCIGNDYGFERVFSRQIEAIARPGDVFVAISTSGNSPNIIAGIEAAKRKGLAVVGMTGRTGGRMRGMCDHVLGAPSDSTPRIQECHLVTYHLLCALVEEAMFGHLRK
jgi:D-sedoheptulose 7-phosphate isomerase